ncbi:MAG TPA: GNAT family N-acetyltransferase [Acidothermaceae bacterium]
MSSQVGAAGPGSGGRPAVTLRPMTRDDFPALATWLRAPHVEAWFPWGHGETVAREAVEAEYGPCIDGDDPTELFVIEADGEPVGFVQRYRISDNPSWARALSVIGDTSKAVGFDYAIGELDATGRGVGSEAIRQLLADTFSRYADVDSVVVAMQQANRASWRALEHVGFERRWAGLLDSLDPSDAGPAYIYIVTR